MKRTLAPPVLVSILVVLLAACGRSEGPTKIGFIVKDPTAEWFQNEIRFAKEAGRELGFEVVEIGATDGEAVLKAVDTVYSRGCGGFVICPPDVKLGPAIVEAANQRALKVMSVDDQFVDDAGRPLDTPHLGISAYEIGRLVGRSLWAEMNHRGWDVAEVGACVLTHEQLPTAMERVRGAVDGLRESGFPEEQIYRIAHPKQTIESANDATDSLVQQHADTGRWLVCGMNDDAVLGGVRRLEQDYPPRDIIGIGINGDAAAIAEFERAEVTGFFGTIQLEAKKHGHDTAVMMYRWVAEDVAPPKETLTVGRLITRDNHLEVRRELGLLD